MANLLYVHFFTLTDTHASEHVYAGALGNALTEREIDFVDDWRDADVIHLFEYNFFTRAAIDEFRYSTLLRALRSETPAVVSTDDLYFTEDPSLTARPRLYPINHYAQRFLFSQCDAVIALSESVQKNLLPYVDRGKLHVVHHGVDDRYGVESVDIDAPFVLHVSLAAPRKNPDAIKAIAARLDTRFVIAGSGWDDVIPDTPIYNNVEVLGYVPEDELIDLYKRATVFYFPTLHEGFGLPVLESMAAGCAVVTSNVYSVPEVTDGAALLYDPYDTAAHSRAIERLLANPEERRNLAVAAIERSKQFTWADAALRTEAVYRSVLNGSE